MGIPSDQVWDVVLDEAWDSYRIGGYGVGVVVLDRNGELIRSAGNQSRSADAGLSFIGHAEIRAIGMLSAEQQTSATLCTSLEPCVSCLGAAVYCRVPAISFAARDLSFSSVHAGLARTPLISGRVPRSSGPLVDRRGAFCRLLSLVSEIENGWLTAHGLEGRLTPTLLRLAGACVHERTFAAHRDGAGTWRGVLDAVADALDPVVRELAALERTLRRLGVL
jgi:tRNA(Arg) A34 adenosine deaminase TadA